VLTETTVALLLEQLEAGVSVSAAARWCSVSRRVVYQAMERGRDQPPGTFLRVFYEYATRAIAKQRRGRRGTA